MKISELLREEQRDKYCSDKCCGSDVKAEDCKCPPDCKGCNCNNPNVSETASAGGMAAGAVASVANPTMARSKPKKKKGIAKNALDTSDNLMGGKTIKR